MIGTHLVHTSWMYTLLKRLFKKGCLKYSYTVTILNYIGKKITLKQRWYNPLPRLFKILNNVAENILNNQL